MTVQRGGSIRTKNMRPEAGLTMLPVAKLHVVTISIPSIHEHKTELMRLIVLNSSTSSQKKKLEAAFPDRIVATFYS